MAHLAHALGLGHLAAAEDAVQRACQRALAYWPADGVPDNPAGWLYRVAWRLAVDQLRADARLQPLPEDDGPAPDVLSVPPPEGRFAGELDDDEMALLFAACHPRLPPASQVALALRAACALELGVIARALLCSEAALAQRLARARSQLAGQPLQVPAGAELPPRREAVLSALMLMFHLGMQAEAGGPCTGDAADMRMPGVTRALCWEAIRLARALAEHPAAAHADADALCAVLLLHGARLSGRFDAHGDIVPLPGQPRDRWDAGMLRMGLAHLQAAQRADRLSRWHLLAGIAAEHATAADWAHTDWPAIVRHYALLLQLDPSAAPRLGHAIALAEAGDAPAARAALQALLPQVPAALKPHTLAALARAHQRAGEHGAACEHLRQAVACCEREADRRLLMQRLTEVASRA